MVLVDSDDFCLLFHLFHLFPYTPGDEAAGKKFMAADA